MSDLKIVGDVEIVRLINGDQLVGSVSKPSRGSVIISNPMLLQESIADDSNTGAILLPYNQFAQKTEVKISTDFILHRAPISPMMMSYYKTSIEYLNRIHFPSMAMSVLKAAQQMSSALAFMDENERQMEEMLKREMAGEADEEEQPRPSKPRRKIDIRAVHPGSNTIN